MKKFIDFIHKYVQPKEDELATIIGCCHIKSYKKDALLLCKGQVAQNFVYLKKGAIRFFKKDKGRETTIWVALDDNLAFEMTSYFTGRPTSLYLQAIEDTEVYVIDRKNINKMITTMPVWQEFYRKLWEETIVLMIERITSLLEDSAAKRYERLLTESEYPGRVPLKDLASFIGIAPGSLNRLRSNIR